MTVSEAKKKARALVEQMTPYERMSQLLFNSPAIERLGIHEHNWWNEAAHGVARAGVATVFPQAIAMAATFDPTLVETVAEAVSTEARAKYNKSVAYDDRDIYKGLTFWTPNINIFRDPRWGRGQETFGEDPFLTASMGVAYIKGLQGDGEFLRSAACAKHFAVHSGPERLRHGFDAVVSEKDLWETYLPAFEKAVEAGVAGVMGAYNRTNGEPCCAHSRLLGEILRKQWEFDGYVVSDCGAILDISEHHHYTETMKEAAALALQRGCNINCGEAYACLVDAYEEDMITDEDITEAAVRAYTTRVLLGEFEEPRPFADVPYSRLDCAEHKALNEQVARQSLVLLKNENRFLPLKDGAVQRIAVVGPNGNSTTVLEGNYSGYASEYITVAEGMRRVFTDAQVTVAAGSLLWAEGTNQACGFWNLRTEGMAAASEADLTVLCLGLDRTIEGEEIAGLDDDFADGGDKKTVRLPQTQMRLAEAVCDVCENVVVVVLCGSAVDLGERVRTHAKAIIHGWYPGARGGLAVAELLAGRFSPCGKLPLTFYREETVLPEFTDYGMQGRTYRYFEEEPLYPFGYGLSYVPVRYEKAELLTADERQVRLEVTVTNEGTMAATEKVQVYARFTDNRTSTPRYQLCGMAAVALEAGETGTAEVTVDRYWLKAVLSDGQRVEPDGEITLFIGGHQPDPRSVELCGDQCLTLSIK